MDETYYSLTEFVKLTDNLIAAMPTSYYSGIMAVRGGLASIPAADVVARDCYDRLLAENDELRKERPVVRCKDCICFHPTGTSKHNGDCDKHYERVQCDDFCSWAEVEQDG